MNALRCIKFSDREAAARAITCLYLEHGLIFNFMTDEPWIFRWSA